VFTLHAVKALTCRTDTSRLTPLSVVYNVLEHRFGPDPFSSSAKRHFVFCVPEEWYRRSNSKSLSLSSPTEPSESTLKRLASADTTDQDVEEGTAKVLGDPQLRSADEGNSSDWKGTFSQHRISSLFESWFAPASPNSANRAGPATSSQRKNVSEPKLAPQRTGNGVLSANMIPEKYEEDEEAEVDPVAFEQMLVRLSLCVHFPD
jgi:diaphanous 1